MKIGIDVSQIVYKGSGVARYTHNLVEAILKFDKKNEYIFFFSSLRQKPPTILTNINGKKATLKRYFFPPRILDLLCNRGHIVPIETFTGPLDLFFSSDWIEPPTKCKKLTTVHDMVVFKYPETSHPYIISTQKARLNWVKKESSLIICDSISTKEDVVKFLSIRDDKLKVVYPPVLPFPDPTKAEEDILKSYGINKPYILSIGKFEPRKNIVRLINAFKNANINKLKLYIAGSNGWALKKDDLAAMDRNVHLLGYIKDDEISVLYKHAKFFVYPSLYEGFGYPVVEAMLNGCPVITSDSSSMREIADNYGLLFDPQNEIEMTNRIKELYNNQKLRNELKNKGLRRANDFTLKKFAENFLNIINNI